MSRFVAWRQLRQALDTRNDFFRGCRIALSVGVPVGKGDKPLPRWRSLPPDKRYQASRALIRQLLTALAEGEVQPYAWTLARSALGQPLVEGPLSGFHASLAYADAACIVSVAKGRTVGVDLEPWSLPPANDLPLHLFSSREASLINDDPDRFLTIWTLKEAIAKEKGEGLTNEAIHFDMADYALAKAGVPCRRLDGGTAFHGRFRLGGRCYALAHALGPSLD